MPHVCGHMSDPSTDKLALFGRAQGAEDANAAAFFSSSPNGMPGSASYNSLMPGTSVLAQLAAQQQQHTAALAASQQMGLAAAEAEQLQQQHQQQQMAKVCRRDVGCVFVRNL